MRGLLGKKHAKVDTEEPPKISRFDTNQLSEPVVYIPHVTLPDEDAGLTRIFDKKSLTSLNDIVSELIEDVSLCTKYYRSFDTA